MELLHSQITCFDNLLDSDSKLSDVSLLMLFSHQEENFGLAFVFIYLLFTQPANICLSICLRWESSHLFSSAAGSSDCFLRFEAILNIRAGLLSTDWPVPWSLSMVSMAFTKLSSNFSLVDKTTRTIIEHVCLFNGVSWTVNNKHVQAIDQSENISMAL